MNQGKFYFLYYFRCNNCQKEFRQTMVYSPSATNLTETYCVNCANLKFFSLSFKAQSGNNTSSLFSNSVSETNSTFKQPILKENQTFEVVQKPKPQISPVPKDKRITGRTRQLNLKVKEKTYWKLKELALKNKCLMTEILEKLLEGKFYKTKSYEKQ